MVKEKIYAIYKGDTFIDLGTKKELAKKMNCRTEFIGYLATPTNLRKIQKRKNKDNNALIAIRIEED